MLERHVLYIFDSYCGWCYGFDGAMVAFWQACRQQIPFRVISGGLFTGERRKPLSAFGFIAEANKEVTRRTGAVFGPGFDATLKEGSLLLDSEAAGLHFAALRAQAPERAIEIAAAWQAAFYVEGRDLADPATVEDVGAELGLDGAAALAWAGTDAGREAPKQDFALAAAMGVRSYPTLLLVDGWSLTQLGGAGTSAAQLQTQLATALRAA